MLVCVEAACGRWWRCWSKNGGLAIVEVVVSSAVT